MSSMGVRINRLRSERRMSLRECAEELSKWAKTSHNAISKWEQDKTKPSGEHLHALAKVFDVSEPWLLGYSEDPDPSLSIEPSAEELLAILDDVRMLSASHIRILKKIVEAMKWEAGH